MSNLAQAGVAQRFGKKNINKLFFEVVEVSEVAKKQRSSYVRLP